MLLNWQPGLFCVSGWAGSRAENGGLVAVSVPYTETALRDKLKAAGGRWNPEERVWRVCFGAIRGDTALVERIMRE